MKFGKYELHPLVTSQFALDGGAMFGVVPQTLWRKSNPPDDQNRIEMVTRSLLILGKDKKILVDTGNTQKFSQKLNNIYKISFNNFNLLSSLKKLNIAPEEITDIIITHLHFDHAGGSTYNDHGTIKPTFPNAKYYVQKKHWELAVNPTERDQASFISDDFLPLKDNKVLELVDGEFEIFPNIELLVVDGHTTKQQLPKISDGENTFLYCGDLIPMSSHIPLPYIMGYDLRPLITLEEKKKTLGQAYEENWILFFEHDPKVVAGRVVSSEKGFSFSESIKLY